MKKVCYLIFIFSLFTATAQEDSVVTVPNITKNSIYVEGVGNAYTSLYAFGYDRILYKDKKIALSGTFGGTYILGKSDTSNKGFIKTISVPGEINHSKLVLGGTVMLRKEFIWDIFNIQRIAKNKSNKVGYLEIGYFHLWNFPETSPFADFSKPNASDYVRSGPWNNIYIGYNLFRTDPGLFLRFGAMIYIYKKGEMVLDDMSSGKRISPLPFPRILVGYTF
ncbi:MAG: hypothetical protein U0V72_03410 [Cytophagales bacterium]